MADIFTWSPRVGASGADRFAWPSPGDPSPLTYAAGVDDSGGSSSPTHANVQASSGLNQLIAAHNLMAAGHGLTPLSYVSSGDKATWAILDSIRSGIATIRSNLNLSAFSFTYGYPDVVEKTLKSTHIADLREAFMLTGTITIDLEGGHNDLRKAVSNFLPSDPDPYGDCLDATPTRGLPEFYVGQTVWKSSPGSSTAAAQMYRQLRVLETKYLVPGVVPTTAILDCGIYTHNVNGRNYTIEVWKSNTLRDINGDPISDLWGPDSSGDHAKNCDVLLGSETANNLNSTPEITLTAANLTTDENMLIVILEDDELDKIEPTWDDGGSVTDNLSEIKTSGFEMRITY